MGILFLLLLAAGIQFFFADAVQAQPPSNPTISSSIVNTKHNLSLSGPGTVKSVFESRICIFCHVPHMARSDIPYLWNRNDSTASYIPYQSSTLYATVGQPTGSSKLCLSCHDGTIALGSLIFNQEIPFAGGMRFIPEGPTKIGTDLSDDHPVSFQYDNSLATANGELNLPAMIPSEIKLDDNQQLQCTSCHDPHDDSNGKFLVVPRDGSQLCTGCHVKNGWTASAHSNSNAIWNGLGTNPWPNAPLTSDTVSKNSCENCHYPHSAGGHERLLRFSFEEDNCLVCHNGNVASKDIESDLLKPYRHAVQNYTGIHDPVEDFTLTVQDHVECTDCHNPHWAKADTTTVAPTVSAVSGGTTGIDVNGQYISPVNNQYEICYKCHADNNVISTMLIDRQIQQLNTRLEFDPSSPSYHPVEIQGANPDVPSLLPPLSVSDVIYCTDCHSSDSASGAAGPHGSTYQYLLKENYITQDFTAESSLNYALCYSCHDRNNILGDNSFAFHSAHIVLQNTPCSACHDAHGISSTQGNSINNSHLINFDITIVQPDSQGRLRFEDTGTFSGVCYLNCHGAAHEPRLYP